MEKTRRIVLSFSRVESDECPGNDGGKLVLQKTGDICLACSVHPETHFRSANEAERDLFLARIKEQDCIRS